MAVVKEYKIGNTIVRVHDDSYKDKTQEDIDKIIKRIEEIANRSITRHYQEECPIS
ncbi:hypothetical protein [Proteiniborus sp.]|uniref:hypothetical protein n=1 Tax=Proteiniborus sp. TaxID=2079015 RepID=UPI00331FE00B